ncbi:Minor histocompatibility antigen H13 [Portunus trituberculatus]|uniref:Minor histocompatibility antigen H13 n=1 Tax=Portunus trituberculatus TaxID=210409 RepID=A0A5B7CPB4_PORTR|nr:Minor histocompatibility antigen H13 [Portunus trituberculatus]
MKSRKKGTPINFRCRLLDDCNKLLKRGSNTYFNVTFAAYFAGLLLTIFVMHVFKHAQPALLYLVPACLSAPVLLSLVKGDFKALLQYEDHPSDEEGEEKEAEDKKTGKKDNQEILCRSVGFLLDGVGWEPVQPGFTKSRTSLRVPSQFSRAAVSIFMTGRYCVAFNFENSIPIYVVFTSYPLSFPRGTAVVPNNPRVKISPLSFTCAQQMRSTPLNYLC